ncbi:MAG: tetratricopeptide repeat protein [Betaproteobacteria bacterium]
MKPIRHSWRTLVRCALLIALVLAGGGVLLPAAAQTPDANADLFRPEVAKPLSAADEFIKAGKFGEAQLKIREAEQVPDRTPLENYIINRMRGIAAIGMGDSATASRSFEAVIASGRSPIGEQLKLAEALAVMYFKAGDYPKAVTWTERYLKDGGTNPEMRMQLVRSRYLAEDYAGAATDLRAMLDADEKAKVTPPLDRLQMLASCYVKLNDGQGYVFVLDKLLVYHPKRDYWVDAIRRVESRPGFPQALTLDVLRLQEATGSLTVAAQYTAMAQLALKVGLPGEAKRIVDKGFTTGVLGTGPEAEAQRKLRDAATKQVADDERLFAQNAKDAGAAKDGSALVNVGYAMVSAGQAEAGLALMEQGIQKGGISRADEAKLHLAIAYLAAGQKAKAIQAFQGVQGDGTADLARLWLIHAQRSPS